MTGTTPCNSSINCKGCGIQIAQRGKNQKWCSERCRHNEYVRSKKIDKR